MLAKAIFAFLALPVVVIGVVPTFILYFDPYQAGINLPGAFLGTLGIVVLLRCVYDFYKTGHGTLAHWSPPRKLVTVGLYRYTRSPMYLGVLTTIGGLTWLFGSYLLLIYLVVCACAFHLHILYREEPWLSEQFGNEWREYSSRVSRWLPRRPKQNR